MFRSPRLRAVYTRNSPSADVRAGPLWRFTISNYNDYVHLLRGELSFLSARCLVSQKEAFATEHERGKKKKKNQKPSGIARQRSHYCPDRGFRPREKRRPARSDRIRDTLPWDQRATARQRYGGDTRTREQLRSFRTAVCVCARVIKLVSSDRHVSHSIKLLRARGTPPFSSPPPPVARSPIRSFSRKKLRRRRKEAKRGKKAREERRIKGAGSPRRLRAIDADSSNRVHILNAGCSQHSAAAAQPSGRYDSNGFDDIFEMMFHLLRLLLHLSSPGWWCSVSPSCLRAVASLSFSSSSFSLFVSLSLSPPFSFRGVSSVQSLPTEFHIDAEDGERGPHRRT